MKKQEKATDTINKRVPFLLGGAISWPIGPITLTEIVNRILPIFYGVVGLILFMLFLYAGFLWLTSTGDPDKIRKATDTMLNAVIGIAIVMFAYLATRIIGGLFGFPFI